MMTPNLSTDSVKALARTRLEEVINCGRASAGPVISRVLSTLPEDRIISAKLINGGIKNDGRVTVQLGQHGEARILHPHARRQLCERLGVPNAYVDTLVEPGDGAEWRRPLFAKIMREHLDHTGDRYLVRTVGGEVRGVLSDKFRRLDSRPLLDAFVEACTAVGALPSEGLANDLRVNVRVIIPQIFEPAPNEYMVFGLNWANSDFGAGKYGISAFALRLVCLNGMVGESALSQVHLGTKLPDDLVFSAETYRKDTETMVSATRDVVKSILGVEAIKARVEQISKAAETETDGAQLWRRVSKALTKGETQAVKEAFEGTDTLMLPAGKTAWRFSNALSWVANNVEDVDRKVELQQLAGAVVAA